MKLSIIVPVYGVEKYIVQCISSLLIPDFYDYEIIVVNDGTKDKSIEIIEQTFNDSRIKIVHKENGGLSSARNLGIKEAEGEYIWFFDSDDWAETQILQDVLSKLNDIDCLYFKSYWLNYEESGKVLIRSIKTETNLAKDLYCSSDYQQPAPFYIYKKEVLVKNNHYFKEGILHEDALFTPIALASCKKVLCFGKPVYHYRQRGGSITKTISPQRLRDLMYVISELHKFGVERFEPYERYKWGNTIARTLNGLLSISQNCDDKIAQKEVKHFVNNTSYLLDYLRHSGLNNAIMVFFSKFSYGNLWMVYRMLYNMRYKLGYFN